MMNKDEVVVMRAIALCFKPYLKPEEACIYTNLARTQLSKRCDEYGIYKSSTGYYKREELDKLMAGEFSALSVTNVDERIAALKKSQKR